MECQRNISDTEGIELLSKVSYLHGYCIKDTLVSYMAEILSHWAVSCSLTLAPASKREEVV